MLVECEVLDFDELINVFMHVNRLFKEKIFQTLIFFLHFNFFFFQKTGKRNLTKEIIPKLLIFLKFKNFLHFNYFSFKK